MAKSAQGIVSRGRMFKGVVCRVKVGKMVVKLGYGIIRWEKEIPGCESLV